MALFHSLSRQLCIDCCVILDSLEICIKLMRKYLAARRTSIFVRENNICKIHKNIISKILGVESNSKEAVLKKNGSIVKFLRMRFHSLELNFHFNNFREHAPRQR